MKFDIDDTRHEPRIVSNKKSKSGAFIWSEDLCVGCGSCERGCPTEAIKIKRDKNAIVKRVGVSPCSQACPAGIDASRYIRLASQGKYAESLGVVREKLPLPSVCAYACFHPCEEQCQRRNIDSAVEIRALKRAAVENGGDEWKKYIKQRPSTNKKVAIVGSGPAGLTAAYYLARKGHNVTVYEAYEQAGGFLRYGIPDYRLPKNTVDNDISVIEEAGVKIITNHHVDSVDALRKENDAVICAFGTQYGVALNIPGKDKDGVLVGIKYLKDCDSGKCPDFSGKKVLVLGGGSVAVDCARTAIRLGASSAAMAFLEPINAMLAAEDELGFALEEGVKLYPSRTFVQVEGDSSVSGVTMRNVKSFSFDDNGVCQTTIAEGSDHTVSADVVIFAVGQRSNLEPFSGERDDHTCIFVDENKKTRREGIWACGDVSCGTTSILEAVESARVCASSVDIALGGNGNISETLAPDPIAEETEILKANNASRTNLVTPVAQRVKNFDLEERALTLTEVPREAGRCMKCDLCHPVSLYEVNNSTCIYCGRCMEACKWRAIKVGGTVQDMANPRQERMATMKGPSPTFNLTSTILAIAVAIMCLGIVIGKVIAF